MYQYLSPYLRITILFIAALGILFFTIRGRLRKEPYIYAAFGICGVIGGLSAAIYEILQSYWVNYVKYSGVFGIVAIVAIGMLAIFGIIGVFKYGDKKRKKLAMWALGYLLLVAILAVYLLVKY